MIMKYRSMFACLALLLIVGTAQAEERFIPPIFMKAKLLGMSPSNDGKSLNYQFLILDEFGTLSYRRSDVRRFPSQLPEDKMLALFADLNETNYMTRTSAILPDGVSFGSTVLVYARWGMPNLGIEEMLPYSKEAEAQFLAKHKVIILKTRDHWSQANIRALEATIRNLQLNLNRMEETLAEIEDPESLAKSQANLDILRAKIKKTEEELANKTNGE
jgi:hypothetical protein